MTEQAVLMVVFSVLGILTFFPIFGCTGEDPFQQGYDQGKADAAAAQAETDKKEADHAAAAKAAADEKAKADAAALAAKAEAAKYKNFVPSYADIVSYWRLSDGENGSIQATDSAPDMQQHGEYKNSNSGGVNRDVQGALALGLEKDDKAAEFDGVRGYVEAPHSLLLNPPQQFSLEAWIRPAGPFPLPAPQVVIGSYEVGATGNLLRGYALEIYSAAAGPMLRGRIGNGTGFTAIEASLGDGLEHDAWRHIVLTYDVSNKVAALYVNADNGQPDAVLPQAAPAPQTPVFYVDNKSSPLRIAAGQVEQPTPSPNPAQFFKGRIDEVALYRVPIPGDVVKDHFLRGLGVALP